MNNIDAAVNTVKESSVWHILIHPNPILMGKVFQTKQSELYDSSDDELQLPPCDYYIPFNEINWRPSRTEQSAEEMDDKVYDPMMDGNALRSDFHSFLFVYGTDRTILQLVGSKFNRSLKTPIRLYRDTDGQAVRISPEEMNRFKSAVMRQDFQICQGYPLQEINQGDRVIVVDGPMKGSVGDVMEIRYDQQGMKLKVAFLMFNDKLRIAIPGFRINDVRLQDPDTKLLLQDPLIANFEEELIELLHHRYGAKGSATLSAEDEKRLRFLYRYSDIVFEDDEVSMAKFRALMLICVYLLKDKEAIERYTQEVEHLLQAENDPSSMVNGQCSTVNDSMVNGKWSMVNGQFSTVNDSMVNGQCSTVNDSMVNAQCSTVNDSMVNGQWSMVNAQLSTDLSCYLATALYIATHDPVLRKAAKTYRQTHPNCPKPICRFLSIAKRI